MTSVFLIPGAVAPPPSLRQRIPRLAVGDASDPPRYLALPGTAILLTRADEGRSAGSWVATPPGPGKARGKILLKQAVDKDGAAADFA